MDLIGEGTPPGARRYQVNRSILAMIAHAGVGAEFHSSDADGGGVFRVTRIDTRTREVDLMDPAAYARYFGRP